MAAFDYRGMVEIVWKDGYHTIQFIDYAGDTGTLAVWSLDETKNEPEYIGQMRDHPAEHIKFLHI